MNYFPPRPSPSSLQCCRAAVPSQLSRPVLLLPTGLMEWSSKIRGENVSIDLLVSHLKKCWVVVSSHSHRAALWLKCLLFIWAVWGQALVGFVHVPECLSAWRCYVVINNVGLNKETTCMLRMWLSCCLFSHGHKIIFSGPDQYWVFEADADIRE